MCAGASAARAARPGRPAAESPFSCLHVFERSCNMTALLERLRQIVGEAHVLTEGDLVAYEQDRSEEHTSELQSPCNLVCRLLLEKKKKKHEIKIMHEYTDIC